MLCLAVGYLAFRAMVLLIRGKKDDGLGVLGDALAFSSSVLLLMGVWYPDTVLKAIGETKPFLIFAGLGGVYYAIVTPFR